MERDSGGISCMIGALRSMGMRTHRWTLCGILHEALLLLSFRFFAPQREICLYNRGSWSWDILDGFLYGQIIVRLSFDIHDRHNVFLASDPWQCLCTWIRYRFLAYTIHGEDPGTVGWRTKLCSTYIPKLNLLPTSAMYKWSSIMIGLHVSPSSTKDNRRFHKTKWRNFLHDQSITNSLNYDGNMLTTLTSTIIIAVRPWRLVIVHNTTDPLNPFEISAHFLMS